MFEEIWRPLSDYEGLYEISNQGKVKSLHGKEHYMMGTTLRVGYPSVILTKAGKCRHHRVHRLVALTFIPNPRNCPQVDHVDGNKLNYSLDNLRWVFPGENMRYARDSKVWPEVIAMIENSQPGANSNLIRKLTEDFRIKKPKQAQDRPPAKRKSKVREVATRLAA